MARIEVLRLLDADTRRAVWQLLAAAEGSTGRRPLSDQASLDLADGGRDGFAAVLASNDDGLIGYAQLARGHDSWSLELVLGPAPADPVSRTAADESSDATASTVRSLVAAALDVVVASGGGRVNWWVSDPTPATTAAAEANGLAPGRSLFQMRAKIPLADDVAGAARGIDTRPFEPGRDEAAWIAVNNAAFAPHPEQGGWDLETLRRREAQAWFDASGFLLHERDGRLAAFCWTKVHADTEPVLGEIYVIAVHPDFHGLGLGKALTVAGLDHLADRGITTGMLYVDADNVTAVGLYRRLGFTIHRTDRAFVGDVSPSRTGTR